MLRQELCTSSQFQGKYYRVTLVGAESVRLAPHINKISFSFSFQFAFLVRVAVSIAILVLLHYFPFFFFVFCHTIVCRLTRRRHRYFCVAVLLYCAPWLCGNGFDQTVYSRFPLFRRVTKANTHTIYSRWQEGEDACFHYDHRHIEL